MVKILVVDDSGFARRRIIECILSGSVTANIEEANSGLAAIDKAKDFLPDIIFMDIRMEKMDGITATKAILKELPSTSIIMVTSDGKKDTVLQCILHGAKQFIVKPFSNDKIIHVIKKYSPKNNKIFIVDDDFFIKKEFSEILKEFDYELHFDDNGETAAQTIEAIKPDLIIISLILPTTISGEELLSLLKRNPITKNIPVIMMASKSKENQLFQCIHDGAADYILKPLDSVELKNKIKTILELSSKTSLNPKDLESQFLKYKNSLSGLLSIQYLAALNKFPINEAKLEEFQAQFKDNISGIPMKTLLGKNFLVIVKELLGKKADWTTIHTINEIKPNSILFLHNLHYSVFLEPVSNFSIKVYTPNLGELIISVATLKLLWENLVLVIE